MLPTIWPAGTQGDAKTLMCVRAWCKADVLFHAMMVADDVQLSLHKARADKHYTVWPWSATKEELPQHPYIWEPPPSQLPTTPATHPYRKVRFEGAPSAMAKQPFQTEELHVMVDYVAGQRYVVEACANTSAPYGDKFEIFFRTTIASEAATTCVLQDVMLAPGNALQELHMVVYVIVWQPSMNRLLRPVVHKAIEGGVAGTFKTLRGILHAAFSLEDAKDSEVDLKGVHAEEASLPPAVAGLGTPAAEGHGAAAAVAPAVPAAHTLPAVADRAMSAACPLEHMPVARMRVATGNAPPLHGAFLDYLSDHVVYRGQVSSLSDLIATALRSFMDAALIARVLALLLTLAVIHVTVAFLACLQAFCANACGARRLACWPIQLMDLPDSTAEVLTSLMLVAVINYGIILASAVLTKYLSSGRQNLASQAQAPVLPTTAPLASAASTGSQLVDSVAKPSPTACGSEDTSLLSPAAPATAEEGTAAMAAPATTVASTSNPLDIKPTAVSAICSSTVPVSTPLISPTTASPPTPPAHLHQPATLPSQVEMATFVPPASVPIPHRPIPIPPPSNSIPIPPQALAAAAAAKAAMAAAAAGKPEVAEAVISSVKVRPPAPPPAPLAAPVLAPIAAVLDALGSSHRTGNGGSAASQPPPVPPLATAVPVEENTWVNSWNKSLDSFNDLTASWAFHTARKEAPAPKDGLPPIKEASSLPGMTKWTSSADSEKLPSLPAQPPIEPASMPSLERHSADALLPGGVSHSVLEAHSSMDHALSLERRSGEALSAEGSIGGASAEGALVGLDSEPNVVIEELFENERFQPFRTSGSAWGHSWPGHFLPSDRCGHWSDRSGRPGGPTSMLFEKTAPRLRTGWKWVEDQWEVDMGGLDSEAVDKEGWTYAVDFTWLKYPPGPGQGRCSIKHFVRRRRYFRTRVRVFSPEECKAMGGIVPLTKAKHADHSDNDDEAYESVASLVARQRAPGVGPAPDGWGNIAFEDPLGANSRAGSQANSRASSPHRTSGHGRNGRSSLELTLPPQGHLGGPGHAADPALPSIQEPQGLAEPELLPPPTVAPPGPLPLRQRPVSEGGTTTTAPTAGIPEATLVSPCKGGGAASAMRGAGRKLKQKLGTVRVKVAPAAVIGSLPPQRPALGSLVSSGAVSGAESAASVDSPVGRHEGLACPRCTSANGLDPFTLQPSEVETPMQHALAAAPQQQHTRAVALQASGQPSARTQASMGGAGGAAQHRATAEVPGILSGQAISSTSSTAPRKLGRISDGFQASVCSRNTSRPPALASAEGDVEMVLSPTRTCMTDAPSNPAAANGTLLPSTTAGPLTSSAESMATTTPASNRLLHLSLPSPDPPAPAPAAAVPAPLIKLTSSNVADNVDKAAAASVLAVPQEAASSSRESIAAPATTTPTEQPAAALSVTHTISTSPTEAMVPSQGLGEASLSPAPPTMHSPVAAAAPPQAEAFCPPIGTGSAAAIEEPGMVTVPSGMASGPSGGSLGERGSVGDTSRGARRSAVRKGSQESLSSLDSAIDLQSIEARLAELRARSRPSSTLAASGTAAARSTKDDGAREELKPRQWARQRALRVAEGEEQRQPAAPSIGGTHGGVNADLDG